MIPDTDLYTTVLFVYFFLSSRLVLLEPRHHHSTFLLEKLHWLPISERIKYKVACMCFSAINDSCSAYPL